MQIDDISSEPAAAPTRTKLTWLRCVFWALSAVLLAFSTACYWQRFDACTVITLFPPWCWTGIGIAFALFGFSRRQYMPSALLVCAWLAFLVLFSDTPFSFARTLRAAPERGPIRVVSLNCAGESEAAREVVALQPDIVLIQESPWADTLSSLATQMFGSRANLVRGPDASILARGDVTAVAIPREFRENFVHARIELDGRTINVISLRLNPCPVRLDLWSPDCWRYFQSNHESRRRQLARIVDYVKTLPADEPIILGGDFNCPPRDAVLRLLEPRLTDAFAAAGRGWGATIIELRGLPLIRIDQIWTSRPLQATNVFAHAAAPSDHHMTVADFSLDGS